MKKAILNKINKFLFEHWDPIGVNIDHAAHDEYSVYTEDIYFIILNSKSYQQLFDYLRKIETQNMGIEGDLNKTEITAQTLFTYKSEIKNEPLGLN